MCADVEVYCTGIVRRHLSLVALVVLNIGCCKALLG